MGIQYTHPGLRPPLPINSRACPGPEPGGWGWVNKKENQLKYPKIKARAAEFRKNSTSKESLRWLNLKKTQNCDD